MNWIKDNLILLLAGLAIVLGTGWVITTYVHKARYAQLDTQFVQANADKQTAVDANVSTVATLKRLVVSTNRLVAASTANIEAAKKAGARVDAYKRELAQASAETRVLRAQLAAQNPDVDAYLRTAMPRKLYCQTWPEQCP